MTPTFRRRSRRVLAVAIACLAGAPLAGAAAAAPDAGGPVAAAKPPPTRADLAITVTAPSVVIAGGPLRYRITVRNRGPGVARRVRVTIEGPPGLGLVRGPAAVRACAPASHALTALRCEFATLRARGVRSLTFAGVSAPEGRLRLRAAVQSATPDPTPGDAKVVVLSTARPAPSPQVAAPCELRYAGAPQALGVDDLGYGATGVRVAGSIQGCPIGAAVQVTVCVLEQRGDGSWATLACEAGPAVRVASGKGARGAMASLDGPCPAPGYFRTTVTGGDPYPPHEWVSALAWIRCGPET